MVDLGETVAATIHQVAQLSYSDQNLSDVIKMFSLQIIQQPLNPISIFGLFEYSRAYSSMVLILYLTMAVKIFPLQQIILQSIPQSNSTFQF